MKHILKKVIAIATVVTMLEAVPAMDAQASVVKYATYTNTRFTYTVKYPTTFQRADFGTISGTIIRTLKGSLIFNRIRNAGIGVRCIFYD